MADLESVVTLGFRGEAMPSIASVSRLRLLTRTAQAAHATEIQAEGGGRSAVRPAAHVIGTTIEVRDLFYNVPARRKFVRSDATEVGHIARLVERLALSRPDISFLLRNGDRVMLDAQATDATLQPVEARVRAIIGNDFLEQALPFEHAAGSVWVGGWLGLPTALTGFGRPAVLVREWPQRPRPIAHECGASRLSRRAVSRQVSRVCAVSDPGSRHGGCQRASHQT